jgi:segregation and condensation protein A
MINTKIQQFEGPLDLLLSLIEEQKLDITKIALAEVTEQFLKHIKQLEIIDPTTLADYLTIAAKLLVIKSKAILPTLEIPTDEDEDPSLDLTSKLLTYKQFKEIAKYIKGLDQNGHQSFVRTGVFIERISFFPDSNITKDTLRHAIDKIVQGLKELDNLPKAKVKEAISIQEKIDQLQTILSNQIETNLSTLLSNAKNKTEAITTFLALLELIKQRILTVEQEAIFTEITIKKYQSQEQNDKILISNV